MAIRLNTILMNNPENPSLLESFLNIAKEDQAIALPIRSYQDRPDNTVSGDSPQYRYT